MMGSLHNSILNRMRMHRNVALDRSETNAPSSCIRKSSKQFRNLTMTFTSEKEEFDESYYRFDSVVRGQWCYICKATEQLLAAVNFLHAPKTDEEVVFSIH